MRRVGRRPPAKAQGQDNIPRITGVTAHDQLRSLVDYLKEKYPRRILTPQDRYEYALHYGGKVSLAEEIIELLDKKPEEEEDGDVYFPA